MPGIKKKKKKMLESWRTCAISTDMSLKNTSPLKATKGFDHPLSKIEMVAWNSALSMELKSVIQLRDDKYLQKVKEGNDLCA